MSIGSSCGTFYAVIGLARDRWFSGARGPYKSLIRVACRTTPSIFPVGFEFNSFYVITGDVSAVQNGIHPLQRQPSSSSRIPRRRLRRCVSHTMGRLATETFFASPIFWGLDSAVLENFKISEKRGRIQVRWDSVNAFYHKVFALPNANVTPASFG